MFSWSETYSVGIPLIDEQHQKLFRIANEIAEKLEKLDTFKEYSFIEIMDSMDALFDYTKYHFSQEEKLMSYYHYDKLSEHIEEHQRFIEYLNKVDYHKVESNPEESLKELTRFITTWVFNHIMNSDFQYKEQILGEMSKEEI